MAGESNEGGIWGFLKGIPVLGNLFKLPGQVAGFAGGIADGAIDLAKWGIFGSLLAYVGGVVCKVLGQVVPGETGKMFTALGGALSETAKQVWNGEKKVVGAAISTVSGDLPSTGGIVQSITDGANKFTATAQKDNIGQAALDAAKGVLPAGVPKPTGDHNLDVPTITPSASANSNVPSKAHNPQRSLATPPAPAPEPAASSAAQSAAPVVARQRVPAVEF